MIADRDQIDRRIVDNGNAAQLSLCAMEQEFVSYRSIIQSALVERVRKNPNYSLRSLGRQVGIAQSFLSEVLSGRKNLSFEKAANLARKLGLGEQETEYFLLSVQFESAKHPDLKERLRLRLSEFNQEQKTHLLSLDRFKLIRDWYHVAIYELTEIRDFVMTPKNIAGCLGISETLAQDTLERMLRLELIEKSETGYRKTHAALLAKADSMNVDLREFHQQMLHKAEDSLSHQKPSERITASETFAFDPSQLPECQRLTEEYLDRVAALTEGAPAKTDVYHLAIHFFNLTKKEI